MSLNKSILILVMADNSDFSRKEQSVVESTWARPVIDGKYENIMYYAYTAMDDDMRENTAHKNLGVIDNVCSTIFVPTDDDLYATYKKTYVALKTLEPVIRRYRFDYIFKTDLKTYVNVPLLNEFVQTYINDFEEVIYTGLIKSAKQAIGPRSFCLFADRSSMLIPVKPYYNVLTELKYRSHALKNDTVKCTEEWDAYRKNVDENAMGFIMDNYLMALGRDHYEYYKDWNMRTFDEIEESEWHKQIVMNIRHCRCHICEFDDHRYVHDIVNDYYRDGGKPDLTYMLNYMYSTKCPKIHIVDEDVDSENYKQVSLNEYKNIFETGKFDLIDNSGTTVNKPSKPSSGTAICPDNGFPVGGVDQCYHYSYLDYFEIQHHHVDNCIYHNVNESYPAVKPGTSGNVTDSSNNFGGDSGEDSDIKNPGTHPDGDRHNNWHYKHHHKDCVCNVPDSSVSDSSNDCSCHRHKHNHKPWNWPCHNRPPHDCSCDCDGKQDSSVPDVSVPVVENPSTGNSPCTCTNNVDKDGHHTNSSCACDTDDIWCNCKCDGHNWYHEDVSAGIESDNPRMIDLVSETEDIAMLTDSIEILAEEPVETKSRVSKLLDRLHNLN